MDMPMKDSKEPMFKCPACGEMLKVESKGESEMGHSKPMKKMNAGTMPMGDLKDKITTNPPAGPNLNAY